MNEITYEIGRRIYKVRKEYNWTQQKLADKSGVSCAYISRLENGNDFCPTVGLLCEIARALKVSPKWLILGVNDIMCKDCINYTRGKDGWGSCFENPMKLWRDTDYCSWGERREEKEHDPT